MKIPTCLSYTMVEKVFEFTIVKKIVPRWRDVLYGLLYTPCTYFCWDRCLISAGFECKVPHIIIKINRLLSLVETKISL